jgi:hypothetical protein
MITIKEIRPNMNTSSNNVVFSNAHHPARKYCEWWYFTFFFAPKSVVSGIFKIENKTPEVWIFLKEAGQEAIYLRRTFSFKDFSASREHCDVRIGDNAFWEESGSYKVKISFPEIQLEASFKKSFDWGDNLIARQLSKKEKIFWLVPCVRGKFSGKLTAKGKAKFISGSAFHDHVWHNISAIKMFRSFKEWFWGINYSAKETHLFANVDMGKRGKFNFIFSNDGSQNLKIVDDQDTLATNVDPALELDRIYWDKMVSKLELADKDPVNQWGNSFLTKFFTNKILGFSQYHCFGKEDDKAENWDYSEILQRRSRTSRR